MWGLDGTWGFDGDALRAICLGLLWIWKGFKKKKTTTEEREKLFSSSTVFFIQEMESFAYLTARSLSPHVSSRVELCGPPLSTLNVLRLDAVLILIWIYIAHIAAGRWWRAATCSNTGGRSKSLSGLFLFTLRKFGTVLRCNERRSYLKIHCTYQWGPHGSNWILISSRMKIPIQNMKFRGGENRMIVIYDANSRI